MPRYYGDFHMHSALSPCGDEDMTPSSIAEMAALKELDIIALSDHNSAKNVAAVMKNAEEYDILVVPAMELNSREDVHIVCYFPDLHSCETYSEHVYGYLPDIPWDESFFGRQLVMDEEDNITGKVDKLLISGLNLSVDEIFSDVYDMGGVPIFAHVDKKYNSVLSSLGFIPPQLEVNTIEISKNAVPEIFLERTLKKRYRYLVSSDAHNLGDISEREFSVTLEEKSVACFLNRLKQK